MEVLSRTQKHKTKRRKSLGWFYWIGSLVLFAGIFYWFVRYVSIPQSIPFLQTMEVILFFCGILFLGLYLLAFVYLSMKGLRFQFENCFNAKPFITTAWVISLLYHFALWLITPNSYRQEYYQLGVGISLGAMVFTVGHFFSYFSSVKYYQLAYHRSQVIESRRHAYELLKGVLYMYELIRDVMGQDPEVYQMMRWNEFDKLLEQMVEEAQPYQQISSFTKVDLEQLMSVKLWMENMLLIIEQHPQHKDILKRVAR